MAEENWGIKRVCASCGTKFYDFNKSPIICPNCQAVFDPEYILKKKGKASQAQNEDIEDFDNDILLEDDEASMDDVLADDEDGDLSLDDEKN